MKKTIALLLSVLLLLGTVFVTPASAYSAPAQVSQVKESVPEISQGYGNVDVECIIALEGGIGSGVFELYYDYEDYAFDSVYGYDEEKYCVIANDDPEGIVKVGFLSLTSDCDTQLSIKCSFICLNADAEPEYDFDSVLVELVDAEANELDTLDDYDFDMNIKYDIIDPVPNSDSDSDSDSDSESESDSPDNTDIEIPEAATSVTYHVKHDNGIGGLMFEIHYPAKQVTPYMVNGYSADRYSVICHDDYNGTFTVNALAITQECDTELSISILFAVDNTREPIHFTSNCLELVDANGNVVPDCQAHGELIQTDVDTEINPYPDSESDSDSVSDNYPNTDSEEFSDTDSGADTDNRYGDTDVIYMIHYDKGIGGAMFEIFYDPEIYTVNAVKGYNSERYEVVMCDDYSGIVRVNALAVTENCDYDLSVAVNFTKEKNAQAPFYSHCIELVDAEGNVVPDCKVYGHLVDGEETDVETDSFTFNSDISDIESDDTESETETESAVEYYDTDIIFNVKHPDGIGGVLFKVLYDANKYECSGITGYDTDNYISVINDDMIGTVKANVLCQSQESASTAIDFDIHFKTIKNNSASAASESGFTVVLLELVTFDAKVVYTDVDDYAEVENEDVEFIIDVDNPFESDVDSNVNSDSDSQSDRDPHSDPESDSDKGTDTLLRDTDIIFTIDCDEGIGGASFVVYYNFISESSIFEFAGMDGYNSDKYQVIVNDDKADEAVRVNVLNASDSPDTKLKFVLHFKALQPYDSIDGLFYSKLLELVTFDASDIDDPDIYGYIDNYIVTDTDTDSELDEIVNILVGDVDLDGKITAKDSLRAQRSVIKLAALSLYGEFAADVNNDGKVDNRDCLDILRYSIGIAVKSDVGKYREVKMLCV